MPNFIGASNVTIFIMVAGLSYGRSITPPLPLAGEGWGGGRWQSPIIERRPSSGAARHLLPQQREKGFASSSGRSSASTFGSISGANYCEQRSQRRRRKSKDHH